MSEKRRRAGAGNWIRTTKVPTEAGDTATGLRAFHLQSFTQNQVWLAMVVLAAEITARMQLLALSAHEARRWERKRLRMRLFAVPAPLAYTARKVVLHLADQAPCASLGQSAYATLRVYPAPG